MTPERLKGYLAISTFVILLLGTALYLGLRSRILRHAYRSGNAAIAHARTTVGKGVGYTYTIDGENYHNSLSHGRDDIFWDSMDVIYLKDFPSYSMPASDLISPYRRALPYSFEKAKEILRNYGLWTKVKITIEDGTRGSFYVYRFKSNGCLYTKVYSAVGVNPDTRLLSDSFEVTYWPVNPNLQMFSAEVNRNDPR